MTNLFRLALASAWNRRFTLALAIGSIALSVMMLLAVERTRMAVREGFTQAISGTDLVVGARTSPVQLMLYSVFRLGEATSNMSWESFEKTAAHPGVAWSIPLALGDSHRGFPVVGTTAAYFQRFRYGDATPLSFKLGRAFSELFDVVLGAEVARQLGYRVSDRLVLSHGTAGAGLAEHRDKPFVVSGILAPTGTPVDRSLHVSLEAIEAIHLDWQGGAPLPGVSIPAEAVRKFDLSPKTITAGLIGLKSRAGVFEVQRFVNAYGDEPLLAVLPGVALDQLWEMLSVLERTLLAISTIVVAIGLAGMVAVVLSSLGARRRELAILRSVGAGPGDILALLCLEGLLITVIAGALGYLALTALGAAAASLLQSRLGLTMPLWGSPAGELPLLAAVVAAGLAASLIPAWRAYRLALADGLAPRL